jgi:hypothetical protein
MVSSWDYHQGHSRKIQLKRLMKPHLVQRCSMVQIQCRYTLVQECKPLYRDCTTAAPTPPDLVQRNNLSTNNHRSHESSSKHSITFTLQWLRIAILRARRDYLKRPHHRHPPARYLLKSSPYPKGCVARPIREQQFSPSLSRKQPTS